MRWGIAAVIIVLIAVAAVYGLQRFGALRAPEPAAAGNGCVL